MINLKNIRVLEESNNEGVFAIEPLNSGFGITIGNALRRTLLSSLGGYCICAIKINEASHEFSVIKGITEDVTEITLNIKQIRLKKQIKEDNDFEICKASIGEKEVITAGDLGKFIHSFQVLNPDLVICNKDKLVSFNISFIIKNGVGYEPTEEQVLNPILQEELNLDNNYIKIDGIYSPIKKVKYEIVNCRVGQKTDYESLIFNLTTDGSISPKDALKESSQILIDHFSLFLGQDINKGEDQVDKKNIKNEEVKKIQSLLKLKIKDLDFSPRTKNGLTSASIDTLAKLVSYSEEDIKGIRNLGTKCKEEIKLKLKEIGGLHLNMDLSSIDTDLL